MPNQTALLVVDLQLGMFQGLLVPPVHNGARLLGTVSDLIAQARLSGAHVVYIQHCGGQGHPSEERTAGWQIHPAVAAAQGDIIIQKRTPDAFCGTALQRELESRQIRRLIVTGIQTELCIDTTCRRAFGLGYHVTLVGDGHSTWHNDVLTAPQIIAHHNRVLGTWFAEVVDASSLIIPPVVRPAVAGVARGSNGGNGRHAVRA